MSDVINAHDLGVAGGYIIEAAMQGDIDQLKAENDKLREDVDRLIQAVEDLHDVSLEDSLVQMENENARLREYVTKLEVANLDVTARLTDYIGQYDPTDAFMAEVKAENAKLREELADAPKCETCEAMLDCDECLRADGSHKECRRLRADNAKLRELLEAVLQCAGETKRDKGCDACPMYNGPWRNDGTWCLLRPTLREMGVVE